MLIKTYPLPATRITAVDVALPRLLPYPKQICCVPGYGVMGWKVRRGNAASLRLRRWPPGNRRRNNRLKIFPACKFFVIARVLLMDGQNGTNFPATRK